jgi:hypothetical protein
LTGKKSQSPAIAARIAKLPGSTFRQVKNMVWVDNKGRTQKYTVSHFKYDLSQGTIATTPLITAVAVTASNVCSAVEDEICTSFLSVTGAEPRNRKEGLLRLDWPEWHAAEAEEIAALERLGCWEWVPRSSVPAGVRVYRNRMVYKQKPDRKKARLCFLGNTQRPSDYNEIYAPVTRLETVRMLCARAAACDFDVHLCDVQNAFVNSALDRDLYMEAPEGHGKDGMICCLKKALYGCRQAPRCWNQHFDKWLRKQGFTASQNDPCLYSRRVGAKVVWVCTWVDDCLIVGDAQLCEQFKHSLKTDYRVRDYGQPESYLGMEFARDRQHGTVSLSQSAYIRSMASRFDLLHEPPVLTPMDSDVRLTAREPDEDAVDGTLYRAIVGSLLYCSSCTRPDISFAVKDLSRFLSDPTAAALHQAKRVVRYLLATHDYTLQYSRDISSSLSAPVAFSDSDWAPQCTNRKSTSGYVFFMSGGAVSWASKQQTTVAHSSAEAEYVCISLAAKECMWVRRLFAELTDQKSMDPTRMFEDNQACALWTKNPIHHARQKHIDICHHAIRDWVADGRIDVQYVPSADQVADVFTKPLSKDIFTRLAHLLLGHMSSQLARIVEKNAADLPLLQAKTFKLAP